MPREDLPDRKRPVHFPAVEISNRTVIHFVTICTRDRQALLANETAHQLLLAAWARSATFLVGRYVIMPDHLHLFCSPAEFPASSLERWITFWKSHISKHWPGEKAGRLWQRDYWDTQLRQGENYTAKWEYVRNNPVRAGLATDPRSMALPRRTESLTVHD